MALGGGGGGRPTRGAFWRGTFLSQADEVSIVLFTGAAQTGVFTTVWKLFPSLTFPSCLFPLAVHHAVPKHREDMEGNRPPHLSHLL